MHQETVKCSSKQCAPRSFYPNQITPVPVGGEIYGLCPDCITAMNKTIGHRDTLGVLMHKNLPIVEADRIWQERRKDYARAAFNFN